MKIFFIFIFLFILNCSSNKISNNHGFLSLQKKFDKITVNKTNKNDITNIIGPPSSISNFDNDKWFYIQRIKTNQSLFKLGIKKIETNNILIVKFNDRGMLIDKNLLNINSMNDLKFSKDITEKDFTQNDLLFKIFSSLREKANAPTRNKSKN